VSTPLQIDGQDGWHVEQKRWRSKKRPPASGRRNRQQQRDDYDKFIYSKLAEIAVRQILTGLSGKGFMTIDSYFPLGDREAASKILSALFGKHVSPRTYDRLFESVRREFAGLWLGLDGPYKGPLGRWPMGDNGEKREHDRASISDLLTEVRQERRKSEKRVA
jgi:hypothetical protein